MCVCMCVCVFVCACVCACARAHTGVGVGVQVQVGTKPVVLKGFSVCLLQHIVNKNSKGQTNTLQVFFLFDIHLKHLTVTANGIHKSH